MMTERELAGRLALGTAQFGLPYGLNNITGQPPLGAVADILRETRDAGLNLLDTAAVYGDAEDRIGQLSSITQDFAVVTKVADGLEVEVVGGGPSGEHRVELLAARIPGGQAVDGVGGDALGAVDGGGVAELGGGGDVLGGQSHRSASALVLHCE